MALKYLRLECSCGEKASLSSLDLSEFLDDDLSVAAAMQLASRFRCAKCMARGDQQIWDDRERLLFDPERTRGCVNCGELIPYARIEAMPDTNLCTQCALEGAQPESAPPHPQPPPDLRTCPRCGAPTAMYQNSKFKNWFVGCSTFPKCHWSKWR